jgi:hypothetical protein
MDQGEFLFQVEDELGLGDVLVANFLLGADDSGAVEVDCALLEPR